MEECKTQTPIHRATCVHLYCCSTWHQLTDKHRLTHTLPPVIWTIPPMHTPQWNSWSTKRSGICGDIKQLLIRCMCIAWQGWVEEYWYWVADRCRYMHRYSDSGWWVRDHGGSVILSPSGEHLLYLCNSMVLVMRACLCVSIYTRVNRRGNGNCSREYMYNIADLPYMVWL